MLWCWLRACTSYPVELQAKNVKLDVKMTAWLAGFPMTNTEVIFERKSKEEYADWEPMTLHYHLMEKWT